MALMGGKQLRNMKAYDNPTRELFGWFELWEEHKHQLGDGATEDDESNGDEP
jgi:hypothetical protein